MSKFKRRQFFCDPKIQFALIKRILIHWTCFAGVVLGLTVFLEFMIGGSAPSVTAATQSALAHNRFFMMILVVLMPAFIYDTIRVSNRFAGPMVRVRRAFRTLGAGQDVKPLKFRQGDMWGELADDFNLVLERLYAAERRNQSDEVADGTLDGHESAEASHDFATTACN